MSQRKNKKVYYHLPGLFEFYELYCAFLPLYKEHREYFYSCVSFKTSSGLSDPNPARPPPQRQSAGEP